MKKYVYLFTKETGEFDKHVSFCGEHLSKQAGRRRDWVERWPNYCRECEGAGVRCSAGDLVPYGSQVVHAQDNCDPCIDCIAPDDILEMKCPRCGARLFWQVACQYIVPEEQRWLIREYGVDGIIEALLENAGHCPLCDWGGGQGQHDLAPLVDGCICNEVYFYGDDCQPGVVQRMMFKLFGERGQSLWPTPIIIYQGGC